MKDDEFLAQYAQDPSNNNTIHIADVVADLKPILYQLYWTTPVQVDDVTRNFRSDRPAVDYAAHCLLAGTKLYNAVYQRWCRLVRSSMNFAPEELWWFPSLSTNGTRVQLDNQPMQESDSDSDDENDPMDLSPDDAEAEALAASFDDPRLSRILTSIPQALPFDKRVKLFDSLVKADKARTQDESSFVQSAIAAMMRGEDGRAGRQNVEIRREYLFQDAMEQLNQLGPKLRQKLQVSFINQHGAAEAGIDGGGVFKEFLDDLVKEAFSVDSASETSSSNTLSLFSVTPLETLAINLDYAHRSDLLSHYEFLGRAIGKAVYEGILVDPQFCLPFLNQLLGKSNSLEDLKNYDPEYYKNLIKLLTLDASTFETLGLTFEISVGQSGRTVNLQPGGSQKAVTSQNVIPYAHLVAHQLLNVQSDKPVKAFLRGFRDLIPAPWVRLFAAHELQKIISGDDGRLDVSSFKATMQYAAGYHPSQPIIQWFWEIVEKDLTPDQQCKLLKFMTSCSRQPLLGFGSLEPAPCVQQIRLPDSLFQQDPVEILKRAPLPTSSTCMNLLKLPNYRSKELMRAKLVAAIEAGAGFELT
jgi:ubiquitin-protein ligase E3 C